MDLLLTHGYFLDEDAKELQIMRPYAPLGILYLCSHLRDKNFDVEVYDSTFGSLDGLTSLLRSHKPAVLGLYANLMTRANVVKLLKVAKSTGWKTVVGGSDPAEYVTEYLDNGADIVVIGEGEHTLEELLPALKTGGSLDAINGIAFCRADGVVHRTPTRAQIADIDAQPWPARDAVDLTVYMRRWREFHGQASLGMITARGCPYRCNWCSRNVFGNTHRRRKPKLVADELEFLLSRYSPDAMWMADDVFTMNRGWLFEYAAELKSRGISVPFECIARADRMNEEVVDMLAQMGCFRLWVGCESGSQRVLDAMERGVTLEQVERAVGLCRSRGIISGMFLMWGYEGEDLDDIQATIDHVKHSNPDVFFTTVAYPVKGTKFYDRVSDRVVNEKPWGTTSDRENRIAGRHSRRFYKFADQALRSEVELHRTGGVAADMAELRRSILEAKRGLADAFAEVEA
jgi:anaerobic magnesium-protoporphyrin IX monomethyl ester cyclase